MCLCAPSSSFSLRPTLIVNKSNCSSASAVTFVGLIYLLILAFFVVVRPVSFSLLTPPTNPHPNADDQQLRPPNRQTRLNAYPPLPHSPPPHQHYHNLLLHLRVSPLLPPSPQQLTQLPHMQLFYSLLSLAFQLPLDRKYAFPHSLARCIPN